MKKYIKFVFAFILIFSVSFMTYAQRNALRKANKLYDSRAYSDAIPKYLKALKKDNSIAEAIFNLADCYRLTNNSKEAMNYYAKAVQCNASKPIHKLYYAQALMQNGNYSLAEKYLNEYKDDERGKTFSDAIKNINVYLKDTSKNQIKFAPFNSEYNDFSPVIYDNKVVFVSARTKATILKYIHSWTDKRYYYLYITQPNKNGKASKPKLFAPNIQIKYNDGPVSFAKDDKTIFFTRNNMKDNKVVRAETGDVKLNIYQAEFNKEKQRFDNIQSFNFNSDEYNTAHPAISPDGNRLYFVSDMPGGYGGMDIWYCSKIFGGWNNPVNLGSKVNTAGNEVFPYAYDDKTLYFSSNGLEGIGGLDIFSVKIDSTGKVIGKPRNIGANINSTADDFGITFYPDGYKGYFSSNRRNKDLNDDIYEFQIKQPFPYNILVMDTNTRQLLDSKIKLVELNSQDKSELSEKSGNFTVDLYPHQTYDISAESNGYFPKSNLSYTAPQNNTEPYEILLKRQNKYFIRGTVYEVLTNDVITHDSAEIVITDDNNNTVYSQLTDNNGQYHSPELLPNTRYTVTASKKGYYAIKPQIVESIPIEGAVRDFYIHQIILGKAIVLKNIYFDFDKSSIRPDAASELDKIVTLLIENPDIIIELGSHTDCRGSKKYNEALSDRRAKASAAYIISKGIGNNRVSGKGYGEYQLLTDCPCEGNLISDCSEEDHQMNRRTEFKVTGFVSGLGNVNMKSEEGSNIHVDPKPETKTKGKNKEAGELYKTDNTQTTYNPIEGNESNKYNQRKEVEESPKPVNSAQTEKTNEIEIKIVKPDLTQQNEKKIEVVEKPVVKQAVKPSAVAKFDNEINDIENTLVYHIQLFTSDKKLPLSNSLFKGLDNVRYYKHKGLYKYIWGDAFQISEAMILQNQVLEMGFNGAFVVPFYNNLRISDEEAAAKAKTLFLR